MTKQSRASQLAVVIVTGAICLVFLTMLLVGAGWLSFTSTYSLKVFVPSALALGPGANVDIAGVNVGHVDSIQRDGTRVELFLAISKRYTPLPVDTTAAIRLRTLIGENYVELTPGRSTVLMPSGGVIGEDRTSQYVDVEQIIDLLKGSTRAHARELVQSLAQGIGGRGPELGALFGGLAGTLNRAAPLSVTLHQYDQNVANLISDLGDVSRAVGQRGRDILTIAHGLDLTFGAVADRNLAVSATLKQLPPTLVALERTSAVLSNASNPTAAVLTRLAGAVDAARPAVALLGPASREGTSVLDTLSHAAPGLTGTLADLPPLGTGAATALPQLHSALCQLGPMLQDLAPYSRELGSFFANLASVTNFYDPVAHAARLEVLVGEQSLAGITQPESVLLNKLLSMGIVGEVHQSGYGPYPAPGQAGQTVYGRGISGPAAYPFKYPHITAAC